MDVETISLLGHYVWSYLNSSLSRERINLPHTSLADSSTLGKRAVIGPVSGSRRDSAGLELIRDWTEEEYSNDG